jgi:hypothetical protein
MIVGEHSEPIPEKIRRHIKEMQADIEGWRNESMYAVQHDNKEYEEYCRIMIDICNNTLTQLENELKKFL